MVCISKYEFSKEDYEMYKSFFENRLDKIEIVSADSVKPSANQKHDKTFKEILKNKKEMMQFLKQFIGMEVNKEELERYNNSFINKHYERRESDIIYKIKNKEIYFLIEHQSTVDKKMPDRILEYCMETMREIKENRKGETNPLIVPIVIYTGTRKWTVATDFSDTQKVEERYKEYKIKLKYKLIDISEYNKKELIEKDTKISNMMLLEKCKTKEEVLETLIELIIKAKNEERIEWIKGLVEYVFPDILGEDRGRLLKMIEKKEKRKMEDLVERIKKYEEMREKRLIGKGREEGIAVGRKEGRNAGIKETITNMIKNMLKLNQDEELIMKCTNAKKEEIEKIRKELGMQAN